MFHVFMFHFTRLSPLPTRSYHPPPDRTKKRRPVPMPPSTHPPTSHPRPATLGQLKETSYKPRSVKDELRTNLIKKLKHKDDLFPGIVGYRDTVIPQIVNG